MLSANARTSSRIGSASGGRSTVLARVTPSRTRSVRSAAACVGLEQRRAATVARRRYRWASCSHVKPMPPCTCMLRLAHRSAAGPARVAATAAVYARWSSPFVRGAGGVPHGGGRQLGGDEHVGAVVLHRLVHADRPTELLALLRVLGGRLGALTRPGRPPRPRGRCGRGRRARRAHPGCTVAAAPSRVTRADRRVGSRFGGVVDRDAVATELDDRDVVAHADQEHVGEPATEHRAGRSVQRAVALLHLAAQRDRAGGGAVGEAGEELRLQRVVRGRDEHRAGDDGGHERARRDGPPELLDHDHELLEPVARAAVLLGDVEAEPAHAGDVLPQVGQGLGRGLEQRAGRAAARRAC